MSARSLASVVAWGILCAVSWTWCIGMYLPVPLVERFGWPGFIAFAAPNIVGVVLFGYLVRTRERSERMVATHGSAMRWFSIVTIAYQMFFLVALQELAPTAFPDLVWGSTAIVAGPFVAAILLAMVPLRGLLVVAGVLWTASLCVFADTGIDPFSSVAWNGPMSTLQLAPVAIVMGLGFLLCPFFDLTFHRAIRESPSHHAFALFAPAFLLMSLLTVAIWFDGPINWRSLAFGHFLWQTSITMALHLRELRSGIQQTNAFERNAAIAAPLVGVILGMWAVNEGWGYETYLRFLVFYGLIVPAYAIVFMHPRGEAVLSKRNLLFVALVVVAAAPFYEIGFVREKTWALWIPIGVGCAWILWCMRRRKKAHVR